MELRNLLPKRFRKGGAVIPVVRLQGAIAVGGSAFQPRLNLASVASQLDRAFEMKKAPVVALVVNSPGGSPVQSRLIYSRIRELAKKHSKRVLVFVEDVAASGGYMIAIAGDEIIADETSIVGSIGVIMAGFGFVEAIDKIGVERRVLTAGENKMILDPFQPLKEKDVEFVHGLQGEMHTVFIDMVKAARGAKLGNDPDLFTGRFWTGGKARELGLIDTCGLLSDVLRQRYGDDVELRLVTPRRGLFGRPQPGVGVTSEAEMGAAIGTSLPASVMDAASDRALWSRFGL